MDKIAKKALPPYIKAVILDIDGTLLDSLDAWAESDRILLEENNIEYDPKISDKLKSMYFPTAARYLIDECGLEMTLDAAMERIHEIIRNKYFHEIRLKPYAAEFISTCAENNIKMCAATSNSRELAEGSLSARGILPKLEFLLTSDDVGCGKDSPDIFFRCAEGLGCPPTETAVFEDSLHAAKTASDAGFYTVGVYDEHYAAEFEKLKKICRMTVRDFGELL